MCDRVPRGAAAPVATSDTDSTEWTAPDAELAAWLEARRDADIEAMEREALASAGTSTEAA